MQNQGGYYHSHRAKIADGELDKRVNHKYPYFWVLVVAQTLVVGFAFKASVRRQRFLGSRRGAGGTLMTNLLHSIGKTVKFNECLKPYYINRY